MREKNLSVLAAGSYAETERNSNAAAIGNMAAELASAQIVVYPVDVRGLASGMEFQREDAANRQSSNISDRAIARMSDVTAGHETMQDIAKETGGQVYVNQNEIKEGLDRAIADNQASYTLGYYPEDKKWDGTYRAIKVKLNRDGSTLHYRRGYFAVDPAQIKDRKPEQEIAAALNDAAPDTQVTFSARVNSDDKAKLGIDFLVDPGSIVPEDSGGGKKLNLDFYAAAFSADGKIVESRSMKVNQTFKDEIFAQVIKQGMLLHMDINQNPSSKDLRLAVRDNKTGCMGTLIVPLARR